MNDYFEGEFLSSGKRGHIAIMEARARGEEPRKSENIKGSRAWQRLHPQEPLNVPLAAAE